MTSFPFEGQIMVLDQSCVVSVWGGGLGRLGGRERMLCLAYDMLIAALHDCHWVGDRRGRTRVPVMRQGPCEKGCWTVSGGFISPVPQI